MSITFGGGNDYRLIPWTGATVASGSFTVSCRVFPTTIASTETYLILDTSGGATAQMFIDTNAGAGPNNFAFVVSNDAFTIFAEARSPNVVAASTWKHLAATWDGTIVRLYEDGVQVATNTPAATTRTGNWANFIAGQMNGSIQDVCAFNVALGAADILQLARARQPRQRAGLKGFWPMLTAPGLQCFSGSGIGADFILNGSAPSAGPQAPVPWGVYNTSPRALRTVATGALTGAQLESAAAAAAASWTAGQLSSSAEVAAARALAAAVQTASMAAGSPNQSLSASQSQVAAMQAVAQGLGAIVQSGNETAVARILAADAQAAFIFGTGGGGSSAATRNLTNQARRPLPLVSRRGIRAR